MFVHATASDTEAGLGNGYMRNATYRVDERRIRRTRERPFAERRTRPGVHLHKRGVIAGDIQEIGRMIDIHSMCSS